jgi:hypothetical protein
MPTRNEVGNLLVDLATRIAGEDIANDWLKVRLIAPGVALHYDKAELFLSAGLTIPATSWHYSNIVSIDGYSTIMVFVQVNTPNAANYWVMFRIAPTNVIGDVPSMALIVKQDLAVADATPFTACNEDLAGVTRVIGGYAKIELYNPDSGDATIEHAHMVCLP